VTKKMECKFYKKKIYKIEKSSYFEKENYILPYLGNEFILVIKIRHTFEYIFFPI